MAEAWIRRQRWRIVDERRGTDLTCVRVVTRQGHESRTFLRPCDAVVADRPRRLRRVAMRQALARLAGHLTRASLAFTPAPLIDDTLRILPFQLEPALALLAGRRRLLIADAVGLGKTIQAGLLLRAVVARSDEARALVVAPATLAHQWTAELVSRFALTVHRADTLTLTRLRATSPYLFNPWTLPGVWLASPDFLKQPHIIDGLPPTPWDVLVIDEAHLLAGDSLRHDAIDQLAARARHLVLLTATPHDGDDERFRRLMAIGSRGDALTTFRRALPPDPDRRRVRWLPVRLSDWDRTMLNAIDAFERALRPSQALPGTDGLSLICAVFRRRALSSPAALQASLARRLLILEQAGPDTEDAWSQPALFDADLFSGDEAQALAGDSGLPSATERSWLARLRHLAMRPPAGGRIAGLATLLRRASDPAVVFTQYRASLPAILSALPATRRAVVVHGGLTSADQHEALQAFLDGRADTLVATDVASQGLNLHTASRWAISFDPPWTPLRLEQRVGRVDRFGQRQRVHATILTSRHPHDLEWRRRLDRRAQHGASAPFPSCRRWTRAAEGLAAWYRLQRGVARHWRHRVEPNACEAVVPAAFTRRWLGRAAAGVACYEVPLVTSTGAEVERRIVAVDVRVPVDALEAQASRRARILTRRARVRAAAGRRTAAPDNAPAQRGLFDQRSPEPEVPAAPPDAIVVGTPRLLVRLITRAGS